MCEDALRDGALACVVAEVKAADQTATRRLQLAASEGKTPMLLYRRYRRYGQCPLTDLSLACPSAVGTGSTPGARWKRMSKRSSPLARRFRPRPATGSSVRSEERRVGKECVSTCRSRGSPD